MYSLVPGKRFKKSLKRIAKNGKYNILAVQDVVVGLNLDFKNFFMSEMYVS